MYSILDYRSDATSVQLALNAIGIWSNIWELQLAVPKCGSLLLNVNINFQDTDNLLLDGNRFLEFDVVTDLGVIIDNKLKF